eukprot:PITA_21239
MKESFLKKYQDYCRSRELKDEVFQMTARPNETLEEYVERFQYNLQRSPYASLPLPDNVLKTALIRGMKELWIETLNIMGKGDIYQENFADIINLCIRSSRGSTRIKPIEYDRRKHSHKECPLDAVQTCAICTKDHLTESCPSLPGLKAVYKEAEEEPEPTYFVNQRRQWKPRQSGMFSDPTSSFQLLQYNAQQYALQQNPQSNLRPQLLAQPNPNPNNRPVQSLQIIETSEIGPYLRECNDLQLRSGRIIETEGDKTVHIEDQLPIEQPPQQEGVNKEQTQASTSSPPFSERLVMPRPVQYLDFDILGELQNMYIKIPFLQAIQDISIYAKTIKELCIKKSRRNTTTNPRVQVVGTLSDLLSGKEAPIKYEDLGNPIVTVQIYGQTLTNALVDLGAAINILTTSTCQKLGITSVEPTSTLLELAD